MVWQSSHGVVQGAVRPAGGSWQPVDIAPDGPNVGSVDVAIDGHGNAVAVWDRFSDTAGVVQSSVRPADGVWQAPVDISAAGQGTADAHVAVDPQGNAVAVWNHRYNSIGLPAPVQSAVRPAGGVWQAPVKLSAAGQAAGASHVAVDAHGNALAVWTGFNGTNRVVQSAAYDAARAPAPRPPTRPPPVGAIARLRLSPSTFRAARSGPTVRPAAARTATRISYTLNAPASVRFIAQRVRAGRQVGRRCLKPTNSNRRHKSCARSIRVRGSFTRHRPAGSDRFTFSGRLAGRALTPGTYSLVATPTHNARTRTPTRARFRITR